MEKEGDCSNKRDSLKCCRKRIAGIGSRELSFSSEFTLISAPEFGFAFEPHKQDCGCVYTSEVCAPCPRSKPRALYPDFV